MNQLQFNFSVIFFGKFNVRKVVKESPGGLKRKLTSCQSFLLESL